MKPAFWRKWHRWIGFPAALFLLFASLTGLLVAFTEFFGEEEALREATRDLVSPVSTGSPQSAWAEPIAKALATAQSRAAGAPIDKITVQFKGEQPTVTVFLGKPTGGEDKLFVVDATHRGADSRRHLHGQAHPPSHSQRRVVRRRRPGVRDVLGDGAVGADGAPASSSTGRCAGGTRRVCRKSSGKRDVRSRRETRRQRRRSYSRFSVALCLRGQRIVGFTNQKIVLIDACARSMTAVGRMPRYSTPIRERTSPNMAMPEMACGTGRASRSVMNIITTMRR